MPRRFINQLGHQEAIHEVFLASDKQLRPNRNGNLYLQVELRDRTGALPTRVWNATESLYNSFENGDFVLVEGTTQLYQGALQLIASQITPVPGDEVDSSDFMPLSQDTIDRLGARLAELLRGMSNPHLRTLAECYLLDTHYMARFAQAPAGVKNHHAYLGGLLEHVVNVMELATLVAGRYEMLDADLLLMGAFLHDAGKIEELSYQRGFSYTDEGQLIGHVVMGVAMLDAKLAEVERLSDEPVPAELALRLKHMIVSHHGSYEFGSPKLPMTLEAVALNLIDNLDAKLHGWQQLMRDDPNSESRWTNFNQQLGRKLFKPSLAPDPAPVD